MDSVLVPFPHILTQLQLFANCVATSLQKCLILTAWRRLLVLAGLILRARNLARTWLQVVCVCVCEEYLNWPKVCLWAGGLLHRKQQPIHNCVWISILSQQVVESSQNVVVIGCHWASNLWQVDLSFSKKKSWTRHCIFNLSECYTKIALFNIQMFCLFQSISMQYLDLKN